MTLEEATTEEIFEELKRRFPRGTVLLGIKPPKTKQEESVHDDHPYIAWHQVFPSLGIMEIARQRMQNFVQPKLIDVREEEDVEEEEE